MPVSDQGINRERYMLIPRTAIFLRRGNLVLLIKGAPTKRLWAGKYNGLGGHVERGEDVRSAAKRELMEEAGLTADLWLCGTVIVDAGEIGICLYVFSGESFEGEITASPLGRHLKREQLNGSRLNEWPKGCLSLKTCQSSYPNPKYEARRSAFFGAFVL